VEKEMTKSTHEHRSQQNRSHLQHPIPDFSSRTGKNIRSKQRRGKQNKEGKKKQQQQQQKLEKRRIHNRLTVSGWCHGSIPAMLLLIFLKRRRAPHSGSSDLEEREQNPTHTEFLPTV
jgi:nucleosome binding factor SPN SPT16 subunit